MHIGLTPEQQAFRHEVRSYFESVLTADVRAQVHREVHGVGIDARLGDDSAYRQLIRRFGADGWLCPTWPSEWGGRDLSPVEAFVFFDETQRIGAPIPFLATNTVGPTIMAHGTDEQKARYLPGIAAGETLFAIGYSEASSGTDLASLTTRAVLDGDTWVIDGQKMWTSLIHVADHVWLACRTDPTTAPGAHPTPGAKKHEGISIIIVPTDSPGFSWTKVSTMGGGLTSATYYEDVRVPVANLVGEVNEGWRLITSQLNHERIALAPSGVVERRLDAVRAWAQQSKLPDGRRVIDQEWVQVNLARVRAKLEYLRLLNWKVAWEASEGRIDPADASAMKVFGTEFFIEAWRLLMEVVGDASVLQPDAAGAVLDGDLEEMIRRAVILTFGGGVNEIQRDIIAWLGLDMPRGTR